jgi:hypothetical protein
VTGNAVTVAAGVNTGTTFGPSTASCTGGAKLVGGGADITGNSGTVNPSQDSAVTSSFPSVNGTNGTWSASAVVVAKAGAGTTNTLTAYALCAS